MNAVEVFQFPVTDHPLRTVVRDGDPWFVGADVCSLLDLGNPRSSLALLDEDEKGVHSMDTPGGVQGVTVVNEPGLWSLVLRSRKPEAKAFKRWITHDVLPALRKTGRFALDDDVPRSVIAKNWYEAELKAEAEAAEKLVALARAKVAEDAVYELTPKALQADHYREADGLIAVGDFANDLALWARENHRVKILQRDVRDFMGEIGLLIRGNTIRNNQPTADAQKRDLLRIKHSTYEAGTRGTVSTDSARLTEKGRGYVWDKATRRIAANGSLKPSTETEKRTA